MAFVPICVQCGTRSNPCRCKVVGPTLGFVAFVVAGVVEWPLGAAVYLFRHRKGRRIMAHPATVVYPRVTRAIPSKSVRHRQAQARASGVLDRRRCRRVFVIPAFGSFLLFFFSNKNVKRVANVCTFVLLP
ncbi:hypothetical protein ACP70R_037114 [Stipagrostis hirtigluma subsp. patula]